MPMQIQTTTPKMQHRKQEMPDMASAVERRFFQTQCRAKKSDDGKMEIGGYGAIFNRFTNMGWYAEVVMPGFFDGIKDDRCACLFNHSESQILGRKKNGTLLLRVDDNGLEYVAKMPEHRADVYELIEGGYVYESSFGFTVASYKWGELDRSELSEQLSEADLDALAYRGKVPVLYLERGRELFDVSPVTFAAYEGTTTNTRFSRSMFDEWRGANPPAVENTTITETPVFSVYDLDLRLKELELI